MADTKTVSFVRDLGAFLVLMAVASLLGWANRTPAMDDEEISLERFFPLVEEGRVLVLDARSQVDYRAGHVPGALSFPAHYFEGAHLRHAAALEAGRTGNLVVYCTDGGCGAGRVVQRELRRLGYAHAMVLVEGWAGWTWAGLPVERGR
jgi:rhodanese-related sulfurtransferase